MHITHLGVAGFGPFGDPPHPDYMDGGPPSGCFSVTCDERVNLFIGTNACGKTSLLRAIDHLFYLDGPETYLERDPIYGWLELSSDWPVERRTAPLTEMPLPGGIVPLINFPATRVNLPAARFTNDGPVDGESLGSGWEPPWEAEEPLNRIHESARTRAPGFLGSYGKMVDARGKLFDTSDGWFLGEHVEDAFFKLNELFRQWEPARIEILLEAITAGHACARAICSEVMGTPPPHPYTRTVEFRDDPDPHNPEAERPVHQEEVTLPAMAIATRDNPLGNPTYAGDLSAGTQSTLLWIWALALEMANHYDWEKNWKSQPAILLIDEIENHLHPAWQRRVIPALLEHFPALQIFATTHSPLVVAGLEKGQVHLLSNESGEVVATTNERDVIGWTMDEILMTIMGVDEPTDKLTSDRTNRLRQLRSKEELTSAEETELNQLRRQTNEQLLAKITPLEAQRQRYADLMERYLFSGGSDLTQDGD